MEDLRDIRIGGRVTVSQGDEILVDNATNHIVNQGLKGIISMFCGNYFSGYSTGYTYCNRYYATVSLGLDTTTVTTRSTADLVNKIATAPNTFSTNSPNAETGTRWGMTYTAIWNAGVITSQIGEIGLYNGNFTNITPNWTSQNSNYTATLFSRISAADGDFTIFTPSTASTMVVNWEIGVNM